MKRLIMVTLGLGGAAIVGGFITLAKGEIKWDEQRKFTGAQARLVSAGVIGAGVILAAVGVVLWMNYDSER